MTHLLIILLIVLVKRTDSDKFLFCLTMLQIYPYQNWTVAETHKEREIGSSTMYSVHV